MLLSARDILMSFSLTQIVLPVATYFLILGVLNTRKRPQMLTGLEDTVALCGAMSMFFWPVAIAWLGGQVFWGIILVAVLVSIGVFMTYRPRSWVIYNLPADQARQIVLDVLTDLGWAFEDTGSEIRLAHGESISFDGFAILRNVTIRLHGAPDSHGKVFASALSAKLGTIPAERSIPASVMLAVALAALVVLAGVLAPHGPEIVRQITEFLP